MKPRKFFEQDLANTKPKGPCEKAAFGTSDPGREHFGRANSPHFGGPGSLTRDERGVALIEYALVCALIAVAFLAGLGSLGDGVGANFNSVDNQVGNAIEFRT